MVLVLGGFGLIAGSFLGLITIRLPLGEPFVLGRSACRDCGSTLAPWRLVPLVSYLIARGRCSSCGSRISLRYPLMESACAGIGVWAALSQASGIAAVLTAVLGWQLLTIAVVDAEHYWLPDGLTLPLLATGLITAAALDGPNLRDSAIGAVVGFGSLVAIAWIYRKVRGRDGLGGGDPYLFAAIGAWVGWIGLPSVLIWASVSALSVVFAKALFGRGSRGADKLPFGVYLSIGAWLVWLSGPLGL